MGGSQRREPFEAGFNRGRPFRMELGRKDLSAVSQARILAVLSFFALGGISLSLFTLGRVSAADGGHLTLADRVRAADDRFKDVAVAVSEGYAPIPCASGVDGGAMGVHYVNTALIGETVDIKQPQAIMYEPKPDGKMELIAVEYITTKGPASLGGQLFNFTGTPNRYGLPAFYELHVWAWKANLRGAFADMNPAVS